MDPDQVNNGLEPIISDELRKHQQRAGHIGGLSRSDAKRTAVRANLAKARAARWKPKLAGQQSNVLGSPQEDAPQEDANNEQREPNSSPSNLP